MASPAVVEVYWGYPSMLEQSIGLLDPLEQGRLDTLYRPRDRDRYLTAHALMRLVLADHTGIEPGQQRFTRTCRICGGPHGKPKLVPGGAWTGLVVPHVSLSYAGNRVLVALSYAEELGVDVDRWAATAFPGFSALALTEAEAAELIAFRPQDRTAAKTVWWVRKEAALKATGHGLRVDTASLRVTPPDQPPRLLAWDDAEVPAPTLTMADLPVEGQYAAAVAVLGEHDLEVRMHDANDRLTLLAVS
ncbi:MAG TPA: 4'-phosphopantetheinyl transferase superfamily protein [Dermatophilaceae bacterium]|nr:4'-phosphopantetheinyl transferase superfamily protein [Dermatophilaceae bacterium]